MLEIQHHNVYNFQYKTFKIKFWKKMTTSKHTTLINDDVVEFIYSANNIHSLLAAV